MESYEQFCHYIVHRYPFYGYGMWIILDKVTGKVIGRAGLEEREIEGEVYTELGYVLHPSYQGKGIAFEICQEILSYAQHGLYMEEIYGFTHLDNIASQRLLRKLGFEFQGEKWSGGIRLKCYYKKLMRRTKCYKS